MVLIVLKQRAPKGSGKKDKEEVFTIEKKQVTVAELKREVAKRSKISPERQKLTNDAGEWLKDDDKTIDTYQVGGELGSVAVKDLGMQISWKTVFLIEYASAGPLIIHPLVYFFGQKLIYREEFQYSKMQQLAFIMILVHYLKREFETLFVHRFSHATMPFLNLFKNSAHYWILSGIALAIPLYGPWHSKKAQRLAGNSFRWSDEYLYLCVAVWAFSELSNAIVHLHLRSLRPAGTKTRKLPTGYGFSFAYCPNYTFEALGWTAFSLLTLDWASWGFTIIGLLQMVAWAMKKKAAYKKEFGKAADPRKAAIIPGII